ncbi:MAG: hypothetical protein ACI81L_001298 [Verrucomicrobiales bacterium]|jgi:hypothetical protein
MSLQGTLTTLGITEVLEFLAARNATGQLDVTTEMGTAMYLFSNGEVAEAEYSFIRESGSDSAAATYYVVSEQDGSFFFNEDEQPIDTDSCEPVGSLLARTAEMAERWLEVEGEIPTPNHLLTRNKELDGSVTIEPEWWKALEIIGEGKTSLQIAKQLDMSALDASLTALAMARAGLLNVNRLDPLEIDMGLVPSDEPAAPVDSFVEQTQPHAASDESQQVATTPAPVEVAEIRETAASFQPAFEAAPAEVAAAEPEPTIEPDMAWQQTTPAGEDVPQVLPEPEALADTADPHPVVDDDGWSSNHYPAFNESSPFTGPAAVEDPGPTPAPAQFAPEASQIFNSHPVEKATPGGQAFDPSSPKTAIAREVLSDLAMLSDQLGETAGADTSWELDGTFVSEEANPMPEPDADPFGDLGELLSNASSDEDRGSVLKFLRRD